MSLNGAREGGDVKFLAKFEEEDGRRAQIYEVTDDDSDGDDC